MYYDDAFPQTTVDTQSTPIIQRQPLFAPSITTPSSTSSPPTSSLTAERMTPRGSNASMLFPAVSSSHSDASSSSPIQGLAIDTSLLATSPDSVLSSQNQTDSHEADSAAPPAFDLLSHDPVFQEWMRKADVDFHAEERDVSRKRSASLAQQHDILRYQSALQKHNSGTCEYFSIEDNDISEQTWFIHLYT